MRGRVFTDAEENFGPPPVVVVTQAFAKKYFPERRSDRPATSRSAISHDTAAPPSEVTAQGQIVGVVNDVHQRGLSDGPVPGCVRRAGERFRSMTSRSSFARAPKRQTIAAAIRERVHAIDAEMPIYDLRTMEQARVGVGGAAALLHAAALRVRRRSRCCSRRSASTA